MPGMDGFEVCRRLKDDPITRHIPVVLVTALDGRSDRITGLEAGADEFLTKPIDDVMLFARVRSLTRLKQVLDELRAREASGRRIGVIAGAAARLGGSGGRVLVLDDNERQAQRLMAELSVEHRPVAETDPDKAHMTARGPVDLIVVNATARGFDGLRFAANIRSDEATRHLPILAIVDSDERHRLVKALEIGVNDILTKPIDPQEMAARARTQIRRKRYTDFLRDNLDHSLELAVTDQLTGLYNRRFMIGQLNPLVQRAAHGGEPVSVALADIDFFKRINDGFGHDAGDAVLKEFALRFASNTRPMDFACRPGGEEFLVIMPNTTGDTAALAAERLRQQVAGTPFRIPDGSTIDVTVSIGVACAGVEDATADDLIKRADVALYQAKQSGRNRVIGATSSSVSGWAAASKATGAPT
jgi:two-component system cell cycle response regulator